MVVIMNNLPAFPNPNRTDQTGMTLRDYFAAKAMQSMNSREDYIDTPADVIALDAYALADAMMKAREA
jgi:hypothetical protein